MWHQLAYRVGRTSQTTPAAVDKFPWPSNKKIGQSRMTGDSSSDMMTGTINWRPTMKLIIHNCLALSLLVSLSSQAHGFPADANPVGTADLNSRLAGKQFSVQLKNGVAWRLEFNNNGYFFVDTSTGGRATGTWRADDGRLCSQVSGGDAQCSEARVQDGFLYIRRADGEVIKYVPR